VNVAVAVPWRDRGDPTRRGHHDRVHAWFADALPGAEVFDVDAPGEKWSLAAARNAGVRLAHTDVVVVCDADNVPEHGVLLDAVDACQDDGLVHLPYTLFRNGTFVWDGSWGGCYVCTPEAWWLAGGQDERFTGWGCEDHAMIYAHSTLLGHRLVRHDGVLTHFPHPAPRERDPGHPDHVAAGALLRRYEACAGDIDAMRALVAGGGGRDGRQAAEGDATRQADPQQQPEVEEGLLT